MTAYPPRGLTPWDDELKAYLDERVPLSFVGSKVYDPPSIAAGATTTTTVTVTGALTPDTALVSHFNANNAGLRLRAWVSATDTVTVEFYNPTGGAIDAASGTLRVRVFKES